MSDMHIKIGMGSFAAMVVFALASIWFHSWEAGATAGVLMFVGIAAITYPKGLL